MRNHLMQAAVALVLAGSTGLASAAIDPHELEVVGTIKTPTCTVTADKNGVYDYGKVNGSLIPPTGMLQLSNLDQQWTVNCGSGKTFLAFQIVDNRDGTASQVATTNFGLGAVSGHAGSKVGYYNVLLMNATVDQVAANVLRGVKGAAVGTGSATASLDKTQSHGWTKGAANAVPAEGSVFTVGMRVTAFIANEKDRGAPIVEGTPLDGNLTLNYSFGL